MELANISASAVLDTHEMVRDTLASVQELNTTSASSGVPIAATG